MPTGTFLTFQALSTSVLDECTVSVTQSAGGALASGSSYTIPCCSAASFGIMVGLIAVLATSCFALTFSDTLVLQGRAGSKGSKRVVFVLPGPEGSYWPR